MLFKPVRIFWIMPFQIEQIIEQLGQKYDSPKTELENWTSPIQFMVSVILSAQATDKSVNKVTGRLFDEYKTSADFANADLQELAKRVSSINFYKTKAERIIKACSYVETHFKGRLPHSIEDLIKIPGIGRKSANVIIIEALKLPAQGIVVDTHVTRVSNRLGLSTYTDQKDAVKIEQELKKIVPQKDWAFFSTTIVLHGRYICKSRKALCSECVLNKLCPSAFKV